MSLRLLRTVGTYKERSAIFVKKTFLVLSDRLLNAPTEFLAIINRSFSVPSNSFLKNDSL